MITMFSTPKALIGHIDMIQRNAIRSWQRLDPDIEIILVGDDSGAAEVCIVWAYEVVTLDIKWKAFGPVN